MSQGCLFQKRFLALQRRQFKRMVQFILIRDDCKPRMIMIITIIIMISRDRVTFLKRASLIIQTVDGEKEKNRPEKLIKMASQ